MQSLGKSIGTVKRRNRIGGPIGKLHQMVQLSSIKKDFSTPPKEKKNIKTEALLDIMEHRVSHLLIQTSNVGGRLDDYIAQHKQKGPKESPLLYGVEPLPSSSKYLNQKTQNQQNVQPEKMEDLSPNHINSQNTQDLNNKNIESLQELTKAVKDLQQVVVHIQQAQDKIHQEMKFIRSNISIKNNPSPNSYFDFI